MMHSLNFRKQYPTMTQKNLIFALCATLSLAACSQKEDATTTSVPSSASAVALAACDTPKLKDQIQQVLQQSITAQAQQIVNADERQFIDPDKLNYAATQLQLSISNIQPERMPNTCQAQISISIPPELNEQIQRNMPFISQSIFAVPNQQQLANNQRVQVYNNQFSFTLHYSTANDQFTALNDTLPAAMNLLTNTLLPVSIKDTLVIDGKTMTRDEALQYFSHSNHSDKHPIASAPRPPKDLASFHDESDNNEPQDILSPPQPSSDSQDIQPEKLSPPEATPSNRVSENDLNSARQANAQADQSIKSAWHKIPSDIQKDLINEQRAWEQKKQKSCRNAATKGNTAIDSQYRQLQCDTRMTRERIQYLNGYSIDAD